MLSRSNVLYMDVERYIFIDNMWIPKVRVDYTAFDVNRPNMIFVVVDNGFFALVSEKKILYHFTKHIGEAEVVRQKKDITLECMLSDPRPAVKWFKDGNLIEVSRSGLQT